jgi:hypothetical protein
MKYAKHFGRNNADFDIMAEIRYILVLSAVINQEERIARYSNLI